MLYLVYFLLLVLAGCGKPPKEMLSHQSLHSKFEIEKGVVLEHPHQWPIPKSGRYLQLVTIKTKQRQDSFQVFLEFSKNGMSAVAFNDFYGQIYQLQWQANSIQWQAMSRIPETMTADRIIVDFLLCQLSKNELNNTLKGAKFTEMNNQRIIQSNSEIIRRISFQHRVGDLWQDVTIDNPRLGMQLKIKTVKST